MITLITGVSVLAQGQESQLGYSYPEGAVPASNGIGMNPNYAASPSTPTAIGTAPVEKRGDYWVRNTDRYGNPKTDLDQYSPGILPQPMGALPNSGPEKIDPRTLEPSSLKGAPGDTPLNTGGCQICGGGYGNPRLWTIEAGLRVLHRDTPEGIEGIPGICSVISSIPNITGLYQRADSSFDVCGALDLKVKRYLGRDVKNNDYFMEFEYNGLAEWKLDNQYILSGYKVETTTAEDGTTSSTNVPVSELYNFHIRSRLNTLELNLRFNNRGTLHDKLVYLPNGRVQRQCKPGWSNNLMVGIRYLNQNDLAMLTNLSTGSFLGCETDNNMLGFQIGGELIDKHCLWNWGFNWKVSPMYNWADRTLKLNGFESKTNAGQLSGMADLGFWADYKIAKHWKVRAQYDIMWVVGLAQATNQIERGVYDDQFALDNDSVEFIQGLTLAVEYGW